MVALIRFCFLVHRGYFRERCLAVYGSNRSFKVFKVHDTCLFVVFPLQTAQLYIQWGY